ncbi:dienelactone hydrolase family protein [Empedobacter brevis]|uniref:dienelactone hydrolase family protein n=1 Tax=Empedobacter brevis TaxID=247 RepID=UPI0039B0526C
MKYLFIFLIGFVSCSQNKIAQNKEDKDYVFFLHNKYLETHNDNDYDTVYKTKIEYSKILQSYKNDGFTVISEKRAPNTNGVVYAKKIVNQIDSLLNIGVKPNHITVIGTSKGGYIAQYVSTFMKNPAINYVFIGSFQESDLQDLPDINFSGNILTIYENSDYYGVSAIKRKEKSTQKINHFKEVELYTGLKHGFLYKALDEWIEPSKKWARRNYQLD